MPVTEPLNFSQPDNELSQIAVQQRSKLFPKNDYKDTNKYSSTNPDAIADGDELGKGTGVFLDTYNGGGSFDLNGAPNAAGSGRLAAYANNLSTWGYGPSIYYTAPDTSGNVGQVLFG